ncbi:MAG: hypothetical protein JWO59_3488, partial [Chloroflexi bacterium]|nr:hypothetical protein [Chloroflexota bacterium]
MEAQDELTENQAAGKEQRNRRSNLDPARRRAVKVLLSEDEYVVLSQAAARERLALGAYTAQAMLAAAQDIGRPEYAVLREVLGALMHASGQVRRIGVNLNQAVAVLNSGELSDLLSMYAHAAYRTV